MLGKKKHTTLPLPGEDRWDEVIEPVMTAPVEEPTPEPPKVYYRAMDWKGVKTVQRCETCGHCDDLEDDIILHVLKHAPAIDRDALLNKLLKDKENN